MSIKVTFSHVDNQKDLFPPVPASQSLPDWYKKLPSYINNQKKPSYDDDMAPATAKKCMPMFDALTAGYIIFLQADVYVEPKDGKPFYRWTKANDVRFHPERQFDGHPESQGFDIAKWDNKWIVTTPKGYSSLFIQPVHRESPFKILEGVVDTDTYTNPVQFIFTLKDINFEGVIPAGTPIAQVIPFKRESYEMSISDLDIDSHIAVRHYLNNKFFGAYKNRYWNKKDYK